MTEESVESYLNHQAHCQCDNCTGVVNELSSANEEVEKALQSRKTYLGDGVYATFDGHHLVLTTENGIEVSNTIYLDMSVLSNLMQVYKSLTGK